MAQQTSSSWYSPHWHHNRFPQLAVVTGFTSAKLAFSSSFLSSFLTQVTGPAVACQACQHSGDKARLKFHRGNPTSQLAIVKWLNKRPAAGNLGSTAHSNRSSSALSTLVATAPTFLPNASMHKAPTKGLLNSYRHWNQPLQKSPGSKICSFQEVFVGDSCQQPKVVLHRSELCLCYLRALANPQAASFIELLTLWHSIRRNTFSPS